MMTLSALAATAPVVRPSGETVSAQEYRIFQGIKAQLANTALATQGNWQIVWIGLTQDRANLAYIAQKGSDPTYAVVLRGTVLGSPIDTLEDIDVKELLPFACGGGGNISQGAMQAFTEILSATDTSGADKLQGLSLLQALGSLFGSSFPLVYVTGHSLGGAMATTVALFLASQSWGNASPVFQVYTFAAPTAGDQSFATNFNSVFPAGDSHKLDIFPKPKPVFYGTWNRFDVVPNAWWNLVKPKDAGELADEDDIIFGYKYAEDFFPKPGPKSTVTVKEIIKHVASLTGTNVYVQPKLQERLNNDYHLHGHYTSSGSSTDQSDPRPKSVADWLAEVGLQHENNSYLLLLNAALIPTVAPAIQSISPTSGPTGGNTQVTISAPHGITFSSDSAVDFGVVGGTNVQVAPGGASLTVDSPAGFGVVDIFVTNKFGTSARVTADQFTYTS